MDIKIKPYQDGGYHVVKEQGIGKITHELGRQYPWKANANSVVQFFETKGEAYEFIVQRNAIT